MLASMVRKEIILILRDKHALAALFIMPSLFILIMSLALKDAFTENVSILTCVIKNKATSSVSNDLENLLYQSKMLSISRDTTMETLSVDALMRQGVDAVLTIGEDFDPILFVAQEDLAEIKIVCAPDLQANQFLVLTSEIMNAVQTVNNPDEAGLAANEVLNISYHNTPDRRRPTSVQQSVPSWIVFGLFFIVGPLSTIFIAEQQQNTLLRLVSMNVSPLLLFVGKIIPYMIINQIQVLLMFGVGIYIVPLFGADALHLGNSLPGLICVSLSLSTAVIGTALLISILAKTTAQATTVGGVLNIFLGALGGIMVPVFIMPEFMQNVSVYSPMSWGLQGYLDIFLRGYGLREVLPESLRLCALGLSTTAIALTIFKKRMRNIL